MLLYKFKKHTIKTGMELKTTFLWMETQEDQNLTDIKTLWSWNVARPWKSQQLFCGGTFFGITFNIKNIQSVTTQFVLEKVSRKASKCGVPTVILLCSQCARVLWWQRIGSGFCTFRSPTTLCSTPICVFSNKCQSASLIAYYQAFFSSKLRVSRLNQPLVFLD